MHWDTAKAKTVMYFFSFYFYDNWRKMVCDDNTLRTPAEVSNVRYNNNTKHEQVNKANYNRYEMAAGGTTHIISKVKNEQRSQKQSNSTQHRSNCFQLYSSL